MFINELIGVYMDGIVLAFGEKVLVGGRTSTQMIEKGLCGHDVLGHVGTFDCFDLSALFSLLHCDDVN